MDNSKLTDGYFNILYDDITNEIRSLGNSMKNGSDIYTYGHHRCDKDIHKQITILTQMMNSSIKLRNIRRKINAS